MCGFKFTNMVYSTFSRHHQYSCDFKSELGYYEWKKSENTIYIRFDIEGVGYKLSNHLGQKIPEVIIQKHFTVSSEMKHSCVNEHTSFYNILVSTTVIPNSRHQMFVIYFLCKHKMYYTC
jgi:hypothetical protein